MPVRYHRAPVAGSSFNSFNPFTKSIAAQLKSRQLKQFIQHWDALEALVVRVFRGKAASASDEVEYAWLRKQLALAYPQWRGLLEPLWRQAMRGGQPSQDDPFAFLLIPESAVGFVGSWAYMQALPVAREALNRLVLDMRGADAGAGERA
jgi:hypothetical protein